MNSEPFHGYILYFGEAEIILWDFQYTSKLFVGFLNVIIVDLVIKKQKDDTDWRSLSRSDWHALTFAYISDDILRWLEQVDMHSRKLKDVLQDCSRSTDSPQFQCNSFAGKICFMACCATSCPCSHMYLKIFSSTSNCASSWNTTTSTTLCNHPPCFKTHYWEESHLRNCVHMCPSVYCEDDYSAFIVSIYKKTKAQEK